MLTPTRKVAVIGGGGMVGAATAYAMVLKNMPVEVIVVDVVAIAAEGQALDISDASFNSPGRCRAGNYADAGQADVIVITAGYPQKPGEPRSALLSKNKDIIKNICESMKPIRSDAKILVVANPVDVLTHMAHVFSGLPRKQVFGSGTYLDSGRLRGELARMLDINPLSINAYVLGEHGDRQFVAWSSATIGNTPLLEHPKMQGVNLDKIREEVMRKAYKIIEAKRSTYFGIGMCTATIVEQCLNNQGTVMPLVAFNEQYGTYMSWPVSVGVNGVEQVFNVPLNPKESEACKVAVAAIKEMIAEADAL